MAAAFLEFRGGGEGDTINYQRVLGGGGIYFHDSPSGCRSRIGDESPCFVTAEVARIRIRRLSRVFSLIIAIEYSAPTMPSFVGREGKRRARRRLGGRRGERRAARRGMHKGEKR